ncbi:MULTISPECIES: KUP/HAK/KT family potassium transporter [Chryseobacterium]|jgi:KUP system potassium uptake protein|uniref:KUP system potassium uptake protein n=1 Tax=Chryseobacterium balustinum TaxID=246 RepID=A0AAX2IKK3_9FLAO|nr:MULTISPECIES: KUP/HAK/KT family potassium transporter [Chryseobacterium]AZB28027.1 potassium transporter Kup [Chryseobacterium balustinum]MDY0932584.1 KUP/HAK/KT family potassium transporter [Chryseobacterium sp. CFBP8996]SKB55642.1 KUP system potassium uptake protein [Chryseobacterium balustinum]SQA89747.1 potassium transport protein Kup [Chryseobacterium balustinum]
MAEVTEGGHHIDLKKLSFVGVIVSLGIVFGDIGTSPLYVMKAIVNARKDGSTMPFDTYIEGALSCIIWTLTLQTTLKYVIIALKADNRGEGGILALYSLVKKLKKKWLYVVAIIGASTLVADSVITPSLTVMSAIEGLKIYNPETPVVFITLFILFIVFVVQQFGTASIGKFFGPIMVTWFLVLGGFGSMHIFDHIEILKAFNPMYAYNLITHSPSAIVIMGAVFLCTTGAEALYSDLGHCGAKNIRVSWIFVKLMLILNYLGQGAWLLDNYEKVFTGVNPFFGIMPEWAVLPAVILATLAAIIASQAVITGSFTMFSEAMSISFWPNQHIEYPSGVKGQMYIPRINWGLMVFCFVVVIFFQKSEHMEAAYGLTITITMLMTTILLTYWLSRTRLNKIFLFGFVAIYLFLESGFFYANVIKFFDGGWLTMVLGGFIAVCMYAWYNGRLLKANFTSYVKIDKYVSIIKDMKLDETIPKYCTNLAYLSRAKRNDEIESKIIYSIIKKQPKRADHYFILSIVNQEDPYTFKYSIDEILPGTIYKVNFLLGFKVDRRINDYFNMVLKDLMADGTIPSRSSHPSLRAHNIPPDLKYVIIDNTYINDILLTVKQKITLNIYNFVKYIGSDDFKSWGVTSHNVVVESAPLTEETISSSKIQQAEFRRSNF